jgi:hypothetical protein
MTTWLKPSGSAIELNDTKETIEKALSLGWEKKQEAKQKKQNKAVKYDRNGERRNT